MRTRRDVLKLGVAATAGLALAGKLAGARSAQVKPLLTKAIPSSGEKLPVIGLGTNRFGATTAEELAARKAVLQRLPELGGSVVDTAPGYGASEEVIGRLVAELGNRDKLFLATKVTATDGDAASARKMLEESLRRLRVAGLDLVQVHNLAGVATALPVLREWKQGKKLRYVGVTTSRREQHEELMTLMRREALDFIQVDYSIGNRDAAERVLPLAAERGLGVLVNLPFGGRRQNVLTAVAGKAPPAWAAAELDVTSFAQLYLKYVVSHPAVTVAIPGTTNVAHLEDNLAAARGRLPDAAQRKKIEQLFDGL